MNPAAIFQVLEHFNDFEKNDYCGHFAFKIRAKLFSSKTFAGQDFSWSVFTL